MALSLSTVWCAGALSKRALNFDDTGRGAVPSRLGQLFPNISGEETASTPLENIPAYVEAVKKNSSPYDLPAANDNPMRRLLTELIDLIVCVRRRTFSSP